MVKSEMKHCRRRKSVECVWPVFQRDCKGKSQTRRDAWCLYPQSYQRECFHCAQPEPREVQLLICSWSFVDKDKNRRLLKGGKKIILGSVLFPGIKVCAPHSQSRLLWGHCTQNKDIVTIRRLIFWHQVLLQSVLHCALMLNRS